MTQAFDDQLRQALETNGDFDPFEPREEQTMYEQAMQLFRGHRKRFSILVGVIMVALVAAEILAAVLFFSATDTREMLTYAVVFLFCMTAVALLKAWSWMQMDKYAIMREIKRLELQIAMLKQVLDRERKEA